MAGPDSHLLFRIRHTFREDHAPLSPALEVQAMSLLAAAGTGTRAGCDRLWEQARPTSSSAAPDTFTALHGYRSPGAVSGHDLTSGPTDHPAPFTDQLRLAVAAYLARFTGPSRQPPESALRCYLPWCAQRDLAPLTARRPHLELHIR